jgi:hypothetical protein
VIDTPWSSTIGQQVHGDARRSSGVAVGPKFLAPWIAWVWSETMPKAMRGSTPNNAKWPRTKEILEGRDRRSIPDQVD